MRMSRKLGYAVGAMGISTSYFAVGFFYLYYLSDIVGMAPLLAGAAFFVGKLWDGVNDPLIGILSDRTQSRFGRKRAYVLFGAVPFALSFVMLWMIPMAANQWLQFVVAVVSLLFYATAYSIVDVPYTAMVPVMTADYDERTQITGLKAMLSTVGTILGGAVALLAADMSGDATGIRIVATVYGMITIVCLLIAVRNLRGFEDAAASAAPIAENPLTSYMVVLKEKNVAILMAFKLIGATATACLSAALPYFAEHILGDARVSTIGLAIYVSASALLIPAWSKLTRSHDKRRLLLIGNTSVAVILLGIGIAIQEDQTVAFYLGCALMGSMMSSYLLIPYSLVPDLVDFYEHKTGERFESFFFGLWVTAHQLGLAVAGLVLGLVLNASRYVGGQIMQPNSALLAIRLAFGLVPGVLLVAAALLLQRYGISRDVYQKVRGALAPRAGERGQDKQVGGELA